MLGIASDLLLRFADTGNCGRQTAGQQIDRFFNRAEFTNKGRSSFYGKVALGQLFHNPVQIPDIAPNQPKRFFQGSCQVAQLIICAVVESQIQRAFLEGLNLPCNVKNGLENIFQHIQHQTDKARQSQDQTDGCN